MTALPLQGQEFVTQTTYVTNQTGLIQQGLIGVQPGLIEQPGLIPQQNFISQPLVSTNIGGVIAPQALAATAIQQSLAGQSLVGGTPYGSVGTTNQFVPGYGNNQRCFNYCPWWLWLILGSVLLGLLITGLASGFVGNKQKRKRKFITKTIIRQQITNNNFKRLNQDAKTSSQVNEDNSQSKSQNHHLRYLVQLI